jgi:hypothetical protein
MTKTQYEAGQEIVVHGQKFIIVKVREFNALGGVIRSALTLRKPRGRRTYEMIVYENGAFSSVI